MLLITFMQKTYIFKYDISNALAFTPTYHKVFKVFLEQRKQHFSFFVKGFDSQVQEILYFIWPISFHSMTCLVSSPWQFATHQVTSKINNIKQAHQIETGKNSLDKLGHLVLL